MSRVQLIQKEQASPEAKEIYDKVERNGARVLNLYKVLAHNPNVMLNSIRLGTALLGKTALSPRLRELAILRIAILTGSQYEWAQHHTIALEAGVTQQQVEDISRWRDSTFFSEEERAVLQYTDEVARKVKVQDKTFRALQKYQSEQCVVELTLAIGYWGMIARVLVPLKVEIDAQTVGSAQELLGRRR